METKMRHGFLAVHAVTHICYYSYCHLSGCLQNSGPDTHICTHLESPLGAGLRFAPKKSEPSADCSSLGPSPTL